MLLRAVLDARRRVMVEMNVAPGSLEALLRVLPCMRQPTVSRFRATRDSRSRRRCRGSRWRG